MAEFDANMDRIRSSLQQHPNEEETAQPQSRSTSRHDVMLDLGKEETALTRIRTLESQYSHTVDARQRRRQNTFPLLPMGTIESYPPDLPEQEEYVVATTCPCPNDYPKPWSAAYFRLGWSGYRNTGSCRRSVAL